MKGASGIDRKEVGMFNNKIKNNELEKDVLKVYDEVKAATKELVEELQSENEGNDEEVKKSVNEIIEDVAMKNKAFEEAVAELSKDSEFEKFTIAFFGQTNAGKSTIIEALRILFGEEGRQGKIAENIEEKERLEKEYDEQCTDVLRRLEAMKQIYKPRPLWSKVAWPLFALIAGLVIGAICMWRFI